MIVLVVNCGSSSLKYQLVNMDNEEVMAKGLVEKIGLTDSQLTHKWNGQKKEIKQSIPDHQVAVKLVLDILTDAECGVIKSMDAIDAVGHRVVHGGEEFAASTLITDEVMKPWKNARPWLRFTIRRTSSASMPARPLCPAYLRSASSIRPSIRPCRRKPSCTASRTNSIRKITSAVTASTARAIGYVAGEVAKSHGQTR